MYRLTIILGILGSMFGASWVLMDSSQAQQPTSRRKVGPGVLRVIPTSLEESETVHGTGDCYRAAWLAVDSQFYISIANDS